MGLMTISVIWPSSFEQAFIPTPYWGFTWNLALIGQVVYEKTIFLKSVDDGRKTDDRGLSIL